MKADGLSVRSTQTATAFAALSVILVGLGSHSVASMKPVVIAAYVHHLNLQAEHAGYLLTVEMIGSSFATTVVACIRTGTRSRPALAAALLLILGADFLSFLLRGDLTALTVTRFAAGLGEGVGLGRLAIAIASFRQPDRVAGCYSVATAAFAALGAMAVPALSSLAGPGGLFLFLGALLVPSLALIQAFPDENAKTAARSGPRADLRSRALLCVGLILYYLSIGAYWPFVGVIGEAIAIPFPETSKALAWAGMAMVAASCLAIVMGHNRHSGWVMLALFLLGSAGILGPMVVPGSILVFTLSACLFAFSWFALFPFLLGLMSRLDPSGQTNGLLYVIAAAAFAAGPGIAGWLVGGAHRAADVVSLQLMTIGLFVAAVGILGTFAIQDARNAQSKPGEQQ